MKILFTLRVSLLFVILGILTSPSLVAQQKKPQDDPKGQAEKSLMQKSLRTDTIPSTIFRPRKVLSEKEKRAQQLYKDGSLKAIEGNYRGAIEDFTQSLMVFENWNTYYKRGYAYLIVEEYPLAVQDFTETMRINPTQTGAIVGRGIARFEMGDHVEAESDLRQYIEQVKSNPMAFDYLAAICFMRKDYQCAFENYSEVIRCDSVYPDAYTNRGMIKHLLGDYKGALQDYNVAIKQTPNDKKAFNNRAAAKMLLKDYNGALRDFDQALMLDPLYADACNNRGRVKYYLGDIEGACADWQKALSFGIEASRDLINKHCK
ncbi:MAG: hypothetical protein ISR57_08495 [Bacteroidales bacterium]|nr:hypothetical protein [Bacteroidota bacterium]MBL6950666.1 hypothetical protein [Bacteroidales bacterium]